MSVSGARTRRRGGLRVVAKTAVADDVNAAAGAAVVAGRLDLGLHAAEGAGLLAGAAVLPVGNFAEQITHALGALRAWLPEADRVRIVFLALLLALLPRLVVLLLVALLLAR